MSLRNTILRALLIFNFAFCIFLSASAQVEALVQDTAYIDPQEHFNNQTEEFKKGEGHTFSGPGPIVVHFRADMQRRPDYCAWEIARDDKFEDIVDRFRNREYDDVTLLVDYEFRDQGSFYIRFIADFDTQSADSSSYTTKPPYVVTISTSLLEVPNLITPDLPTNNVFKVKYQSLVEFEMWIYNRWGQELFHTEEPSVGWDGTYNGSTVPTGAYYYLIKARGTDDLKYVKRGALNVLKAKSSNNSR